MNYEEIAWAAVIDYYLAGNNNKYIELFKNRELIDNLRHNPSSVPFQVFRDDVVSAFLNAWGRLFLQDDSAQEIYDAIIELNPSTRLIADDTLVACDLSPASTVCRITEKIYDRLTGFSGVSMTGFSKIAHVLNDSLFPLIDNPIRKKYRKTYGIRVNSQGYINWMREMQEQARAVVQDFQKQGLPGSVEIFLSEKLGYTSVGCSKSLAKFIDEYYWLTITHGVPIPPKWIP